MICTGWWTHCSGSQVPQLPCHEQQFKRVSAEQLPSDKHRPGWGCRSTRTKLGSVKCKIVENGKEFQILSLQIFYCKLIWSVTVFILQYYMDSGCSQLTPKKTRPTQTQLNNTQFGHPSGSVRINFPNITLLLMNVMNKIVCGWVSEK